MKPSGKKYKSVAEMLEQTEGRITDGKCPRCRSKLLRNLENEEWCSAIDCDFGLEDEI